MNLMIKKHHHQKMKNISIILLLSMLCLKTKAQNNTITESQKMEGLNNVIHFSQHNDSLTLFAWYYNAMPPPYTNTFSYQLSASNIIQPLKPKIISHIKPVGSTQVSSRKFEIYKLYELENKFLVLYKPSVIKNSLCINYQYIDIDGSPLTGVENYELKQLNANEIDKKNTELSYLRWYNAALSNDKKSLIFIYGEPYDQKTLTKPNNDQIILTFEAYQMQLIHQVKYSFEHNIFLNRAKLAKNNFLYSIVKVTDKSDNYNYLENKWFYKAIAINTIQASAPIEIDFDLGSKAITSMEFDSTNNDFIVFAGLFAEVTEKGKAEEVHGFFYKKVDINTGKILSEVEHKFDKNIIQSTSSINNADKGMGISIEARIKDIKLLQNNSISIVIENRIFGALTSLIVANINSTENVNWVKQIPKNQLISSSLFGDNQVSYSLHVSKNKMQFVFNDNPKNYDNITLKHLGRETEGFAKIKESTFKDNTMAIAEIDENGNTLQRILATSKSNKFWSKKALWSKNNNEIFFIMTNYRDSYFISKIKL